MFARSKIRQQRRRDERRGGAGGERPQVAQPLGVAPRIVLAAALAVRHRRAGAAPHRRARSRSGRCPARAPRCAAPVPRAQASARAGARARRRPSSFVRPRVVDDARSGSSPERIAVFAPSSCASFTVLRIRSRSRRGQALQRRRLDVDRGPFDAELAASRAALRTTCSRPGRGRCSTAATPRSSRRARSPCPRGMPAPRPRRDRRCGAARARAARSGCPCGRSCATARSICSGR